ncbi:hypothetical protein L5G28_00820 [Gordonia sp. HY285]|uniref:hypothetical protein n=1 Tax=Gordonia liuliyuniae TaxID=2911517 RepID=UPI001F1C75C4|nr:hypothetical protein [Gordonia liuliyuniae]MCF8608709.1 hypothetical protein [Gordonia liuliyuniae]
MCTALYGTASVSDGGDNLSSCTSVLFIFQQSQQGDGPVVYAVKNPFSLALASPLAELLPVIGMAEQLGLELPFPKAVTDLLGVGFMPTFTDDLIRIVMSDDGPKIETDLFGAKDAATTATPTALAAKHTSPQAADDDAVAADAVTDDAVTAGDVTAGAPAESEDAIEVEAPAAEAPVAEAEAETAPFCCFVVPLTLVFRAVLNDDHRRSERNVTSCIGMIYRIPRRKCAVEHSG